VVIGGKMVMENRRMMTLDEKGIIGKAWEYKKVIEASLAAR
jgi:hypothetical protein